MRTIDDRVLVRYHKRLKMFADRGLSNDDCEWLAERLLDRDEDKDDRRLCIECKCLTAGRRCTKFKVAFMDKLDRFHRCEGFEWQIP